LVIAVDSSINKITWTEFIKYHYCFSPNFEIIDTNAFQTLIDSFGNINLQKMIAAYKVNISSKSKQGVNPDIEILRLSENSRMQTKLKKYLESGEYSDVQLQLDNSLVFGHKIILISRNDFFRALFLDGMKESTQKVVSLPDFTLICWKPISEFLYSDNCISLKVENSSEVAIKSNIINIARLEIICYGVLTSRNDITVEDIGDLLIIADKLCNKKLEDYCIWWLGTHYVDWCKLKSTNKIFTKYTSSIEIARYPPALLEQRIEEYDRKYSSEKCIIQ